MRIGIEESLLPYGSKLFSSLGDVVPLSDSRVDACIVRATVRVDQDFVAQRPGLAWVASATSGEDHLDHRVLTDAGVKSYTAKGCNAEAVADWVELALEAVGVRPTRLGIVGVGHVGTAVAERFDCETLRCDPPRARNEVSFESVPVETIFDSCDVVTLHVPLLPSTDAFINRLLLERLGPGTLLNAARGEVLDVNDALDFARKGGRLCLDVFPHEPNVDPRLIDAANFVTPHVAGHTAQAKNNGLEMCARWLGRQVGAAVQGRAAFRADDCHPRQTLLQADRAMREGRPFRTIRSNSLRRSLARGGEGWIEEAADPSERMC